MVYSGRNRRCPASDTGGARELAPKSGVSLKTQRDLLENYCGLRTWLSLSRLLVVGRWKT